MMLGLTIPLFLCLHALPTTTAFAVRNLGGASLFQSKACSVTFCRNAAAAVVCRAQSDDWIDLTDNGAVRKKVLQEGTGDLAVKGSEVELDYVGTLAGQAEWSAQDVVDCWLKNQQGLDTLADAFVSANVDGSKLMDAEFFTEDFVMNELGVSNKIQCKKLVMASKRLVKQQAEFADGTEFDSNAEKGPFKFTLGAGKAIQAYDIAVATMKEGERAEVVCRADYAYGAEGFRKRNGNVIVPPFATLRFDIKLLKC